MNYKELIQKQKSTREFTDEIIDKQMINEIVDYSTKCDKLIDNIDISIVSLVDSEENVYKKLFGIAGYKGNMIQAPNYIILLSDKKEHYLINAGFIAENLRLKATDLELDSCFITFKDSDAIKNALSIDSSKEVTAIIAIGHREESNKKKIINPSKTGDNYSKSNLDYVANDTSTREGIPNLVYLDEWGNNIEIDTLGERGLLDAFTYIRLAPSTLNRQPWKFIIDGEKIILTIKNNDENVDYYEGQIDIGIIMLYLHLIINSTLTKTIWSFMPLEKDYKIPSCYNYVSHCVL
ncbi:MAG: nitroreductase family protein [Clostridioides sp.]|jgi:hypothetical protein|nr:nitroreductase family protein [Clostridioides sp.]